MTDRELLELAAKAGGIEIYKWLPDGSPSTFLKKWNPLTNDGDALRLAIKLGIKIDPCPNADPPEVRCTPYDKHWDELERCDEPYEGTSPYAATRLAIVRAAAEIGKYMYAE